MKKRFTYRQVAATFLAALVLQAVVLKEVHYVLEHHDVATHCFTNGSETHLHSEEYAHPHCQLCLFHFAPARLDILHLTLQPPSFARSGMAFFYQNPLTARIEWHFQLRGPPALAA